MTDWVVDAKVVLIWLGINGDSPSFLKLSHLRGGGSMLLFTDGVETIALEQIRRRFQRRVWTEERARQALRSLQVTAGRVESAGVLRVAAFDLSLRLRRSFQDGLFLAHMAARGLPGMTASAALFRAARADFPALHLLDDWTPP